MDDISKTYLKMQLDEAARRSLSRVADHIKNRNVGIITAHRGELTAAENHERNKSLAHDIRKHGFGFIHVRGRYVENHGTAQARPVDEHSFMVVGKKGDDGGHLKGFLTKHGEKYAQDSVLHKAHDSEHAHLIGTKEGVFPGKGEHHNVGVFHPNRAPEFHSVMTRGGGKTGQTPAAHKTFAFSTEEIQSWGSWESFGFFTPVEFSARKEHLF